MVYILSFGKHEGKRLDEVELSYVIWLAGFQLRFEKREMVRSDASWWIQNHVPEAKRAARLFLKGKCWHCGGGLALLRTFIMSIVVTLW